jgi:fatty acid desaturase
LALGPALIFLIGLSQYVLAQALHESWHFYSRTPKQKFIQNIFLSFPLGIPSKARDSHFNHHKFFGKPLLDPDYEIYTLFPPTKHTFIKKFLYSFFGFAAFKRLTQILQTHSENGNNHGFLHRNELISLCTIQLIIFLFYFMLFGNIFYYFFFWLLPIVIIVKPLTDFRLIAEHGSIKNSPVLRSFVQYKPLHTSLIIGAFGFNLHGEHHLHPSVKYSDLSFTKEYIFNSHVPCKTELFHGTHLSFLLQFYRLLDKKVV